MSTQKLTVVSFYGGGGQLGYIDPVIGMETQLGQIYDISGDILILGVGTSQNHGNQYIHLTQIDSGSAGHSFSWPTGDGSILLGSGTWPYNDRVFATTSGVHIAGSRLVFFNW